MIFNVIGVVELLKDRGKIKRWLRIEFWEILIYKRRVDLETFIKMIEKKSDKRGIKKIKKEVKRIVYFKNDNYVKCYWVIKRVKN